MRRGFTMIELIFVIVILGILASVAIPKLTATRDDAALVKAQADFSVVLKDLAAYYTSQGEWANRTGDSTANKKGWSEMTNVGLEISDADTAKYKIGTDDSCITFKLLSGADVGKVDITGSGTSTVCKEFLNTTTFSSLPNKADDNTKKQLSLGGIRVK